MRMTSYLPPSMISLRVMDQGRTKFRLWLPLFLLWLLLLPLLVLALVVTLLLDLLTLPLGNAFRFTRFLFGILGVLSAVRGTEVRVNDKKSERTSVALVLK
jgi:hypothetical protein